MFEIIKKTLETGLGAVVMTQEKLRELTEELVVQGNLSKKEGSDLFEELKTSAEESQNKIKSIIEDQIHKVIKDMGIATKADIKALEGKIEALEVKISKKKSAD